MCFFIFMDLNISIRTLRKYAFFIIFYLLIYECYDIFSQDEEAVK